MKYIICFVAVLLFSLAPGVASAQKDTIPAVKDSTVKDTTAPVIAKVDTTVMTTPTNCYKEYLDYFAERGARPVTDGTHEVVITFKSGESCHCFMGKVEVAGGKIKPPLYVQTEGGEYKSYAGLGKKLDPEFVLAQGNDLWTISNGMSVLFRTADQEYGRIFFYKFVNKDKQMNKEAPSPADLLKN